MDKMTNVMEDGLDLAKQQVSAMDATTVSFQVIDEKVKYIVNQLQQLTQDMNISQEKSGRVLQSVENISAVTQQSAAGSEEISASTLEQQQAFDSSRIKVKHLMQIANELHSQLERFKLHDESTRLN